MTRQFDLDQLNTLSNALKYAKEEVVRASYRLENLMQNIHIAEGNLELATSNVVIAQTRLEQFIGDIK